MRLITIIYLTTLLLTFLAYAQPDTFNKAKKMKEIPNQNVLTRHPMNIMPHLDLQYFTSSNNDDIWDNHAKPEQFLNLPRYEQNLKNINQMNKGMYDSVQEAWINQYASGLAPGYDSASDLAIDANGNVYVTGYSTKLPFGTEYCTVKYDVNGDQLWEAHYGEGIENRSEKIVVDSLGNVYVTGYSHSLGTDYDYATVKYNSAGVEQWVARYNGPANSDDYASSLAVDDQGNIYVTGYSDGSVTNYDYATVKYNSSGVVQWVARYNGIVNSSDIARSITVDDLGNIYVTGNSPGPGTSSDYATVKYNSAGVEQWVARYSGPGIYDIAYSLTVDSQGNVFVAGSSLVSGYNYDYATVKYNSAGVMQWVARYDGPATLYSDDYFSSLALDDQGNIYVTGYSRNLGNDYDYATVKYNSAGVVQWDTRYNGPENSMDEANSLVVDDQGNVYVTGNSWDSGTYYDYVTAKYNSAGIEQWTARYNGQGNSIDEVNSLVVDDQGNVYVTGGSGGTGTGYNDYGTVKYNSAGVEQWVVRYNNGGYVNTWDEATSLVVDDQGNVYVTGYSVGDGTYYDYATVKYNSAGVEQWVSRYNGPGNSHDRTNSLAVDDQGNVYVTGYSWDLGTNDKDYATVKYNSAGVEQWVARYNGSGRDEANSLIVDNLGNVYVTGSASYDYTTIKYNSLGIETVGCSL